MKDFMMILVSSGKNNVLMGYDVGGSNKTNLTNNQIFDRIPQFQP